MIFVCLHASLEGASMSSETENQNARQYPGAPSATPIWNPANCSNANGVAALPTIRQNRMILSFIAILGVCLIAMAFLFNTPRDILQGSLTILTSPANLLTDYFQLANIGATLMNVGIICLVSVTLIWINKISVTGAIIAAAFTMIGFSFFGKNLFNTFPIVLGVFLYSKAVKRPFRQYILHSMFGTALSPLVSEFSFNLGLPIPFGILLGICGGVIAGFILVPLSSQVLKFHQGYSLYNIGFTAGLIGMFFTAVLRGFGIEIEAVSILSNDRNTGLTIFLYSLFALLFLLGLWSNRGRLTGFRCLLAQTGVLPSDFLSTSGLGVTAMNMSLMGIISTTYVLAIGGVLNGPVLGAIFTVVGFSAYGKHIKNSIPILIGVMLTNVFNIHDSSATFAIIAALFGMTLAPIAGEYGFLAGILAGFLHMSLVTNIGFLHAGMNLYNNGFSGGFVAAFLVPLLEMFRQKGDKLS
jgi:hypothetical protein